MADLAYLMARLPPLAATDKARPLGAAEFLSLLNEQHHRRWCGAVLAWLGLANREAASLQLPLPFPDAEELTDVADGKTDPWIGYYQVLTDLTAPELIRAWAREDQTVIAYRARWRGTESVLYRRSVPCNDLAALVESQPASLPEAVAQDRRVIGFEFSRLGQALFGVAPDSPLRLYAYAIRLLLQARAGIGVEVPHAA